ncbi:MAG: HNH endonuclease [Methylovirgula sp.]
MRIIPIGRGFINAPDDWWQGFNAAKKRKKTSESWLQGFEHARAVKEELERKIEVLRNGYDPAICPNCAEPMPKDARATKLFCCNSCTQISETVRGLRHWLKNNPREELDIDSIASRQRLILCAVSPKGYERNKRRVPPEVRDFVFKRADYKCERCGRTPGNSRESQLTIQHMRGNSNDPKHLKAYCFQCNSTDKLPVLTERQLESYSEKELGLLGLKPVSKADADALREPHIEVLMREVKLRVLAEEPLLPCDDDTWGSKEKRKARQQARKVWIQDLEEEDDDDYAEDHIAYYTDGGTPVYFEDL